MGALLLWLVGRVGGWLTPGFAAMWLIFAASVLVAIALPLELALISPLFMGLLGWLVDLQPLVTFAGGAAVVARWAFALISERRMPKGGRLLWLPAFILGWTALGGIAAGLANIDRFVLLFGLQVVATGYVMAAVDRARDLDTRVRIARGLVVFLVVCTVGVSLDYVGVPLETLQHGEVSDRFHDGYGIETWATDIGMIRYVRTSESGAGRLRRRLRELRREDPTVPAFEAFFPRFRAFQNYLVVRFEGSARPHEEALRDVGVSLEYDNIGTVPADTVPRWRSFARNSLTYAGLSVAIFPLAMFLIWDGRSRWLGRVGAASALMGAGFSLARGAWVAIGLGLVYALIDVPLSRRRIAQMVLAYLAAAVVLTLVFVSLYGVDPLRGRAQGDVSVGVRYATYEDTLESVSGYYFITGFGTEEARASARVVGYVPPAGTHSTYLNYLFRTGIPGAIAILFLYVVAWAHSRGAAWLKSGRERLFSIVITIAMASIAAHAAILSLFVEPIYTIAISLVVGCALAGGVRLPGRILAVRPTPD